jgi:hypothetical protein
MTDKRRFVIVGASLAGAKAAEELRTQGFEGDQDVPLEPLVAEPAKSS